jgi:LPXTG-motif cell wall-anchored protein
MFRVSSGVAALLVCLVFVGAARANNILSITPSTPTSNFTFGTQSVTDNPNINIPGIVAITGTSTGSATPENPSIATWSAGINNANNTRDYTFTVSLTNSTTNTIGAVQFELLAGTNTTVGSTSIRFAPPTSSTNLGSGSISNSTLLTYTGGVGIAPNATGSFTFTVQVKNSAGSGNFFFKLTATPEPTSLIFGAIGLCLAGGGGFYARRRRAKAVVESASSDGRLESSL